MHLPQNFNYTSAVMCIYEQKNEKLSTNYSYNPTTNMRYRTCCNYAATANVKRIFVTQRKKIKRKEMQRKKFSIKTFLEFAQFQFLYFTPLHSTCPRAPCYHIAGILEEVETIEKFLAAMQHNASAQYGNITANEINGFLQLHVADGATQGATLVRVGARTLSLFLTVSCCRNSALPPAAATCVPHILLANNWSKQAMSSSSSASSWCSASNGIVKHCLRSLYALDFINL